MPGQAKVSKLHRQRFPWHTAWGKEVSVGIYHCPAGWSSWVLDHEPFFVISDSSMMLTTPKLKHPGHTVSTG